VVFERHEPGRHVREVKGTVTLAGARIDLDADGDWVDAWTETSP
jgi:hypothetical protein